MYLTNLTNGGALPGLVMAASYAQQRHDMIAENVANWGNPNYKTKRLDAGRFQAALGEALHRKGSDKTQPLQLRDDKQFATDAAGRLAVTPNEQPPENILFHDGTNMSIERQMSDLAENAMMHEAVTTLLTGYFDAYRKAIRGQV